MCLGICHDQEHLGAIFPPAELHLSADVKLTETRWIVAEVQRAWMYIFPFIPIYVRDSCKPHGKLSLLEDMVVC